MKHIMILGQKYRIKKVKGLIANQQIEGYVESHKFEIGIDASLKGLIFEKVLYHEVAHAFAFECGVHEFLQPQSLEMFCQALSALITQLP